MENLTLVFTYVPIIVILIIGFIYRNRIRVYSKKIIHGKYSYKYLSSLPSNILEMMHPPALRYDPWYVMKSLLNNHQTQQYQTPGNIDFQNLEIGNTFPKFFKQNGEPYYISISESKNDPLKFVVAGYKQRIYNYEAVMLYFFWNHMLVGGQYHIKREKQEVNASDLAAKLMAKYFVKEGKPGQHEFKIIGKDGNEVFFTDNGFGIEISMYNPELLEKLKSSETEIKPKSRVNLEAASVTF